MNATTSRALAAARPLLTGLMLLNLLYAVGIILIFVFSLTRPDWPQFLIHYKEGAHPALALALRAIMVIGVVGAAVVHLVLKRLRSIVDTVRQGDPFIEANAERLRTIAWCVLAGEGLRMAVSAISGAVSTHAMDLGLAEGFSFAPWLAVLLLFVLAGVFSEGARMRADLEGTV